MTQAEREQAVRDKVEECYQTAQSFYGKGYKLRRPEEIRFDINGMCAGEAWLGEWILRFNPEFLETEYKDMIEDTVPHEVAHLLAAEIHGKYVKAHGFEWGGICYMLGIRKVTRCHKYDTTAIRERKRKGLKIRETEWDLE